MGRRFHVSCLLSKLFVVLLLRGAAAQCGEDSFCPVENCFGDSCACPPPASSTLLDGDRPFIRGVSCNISSVMCDGSNSFFCDNGGLCNEIVQGELYTCTCPAGYSGSQCQLKGTLCVAESYYCFNGAACQLSPPCDCPSEWRGDQYCSVRTGEGSDSTGEGLESSSKKEDAQKWYVPLLSVVAGLAAIGLLGFLGLRYYKQRKEGTFRFEEVQMHGGPVFFDDDDDAFTTKPLQRR